MDIAIQRAVRGLLLILYQSDAILIILRKLGAFRLGEYNHNHRFRRYVTQALLVLCALSLAGCQLVSKPLPDPSVEAGGMIKIMYYNEYQFMHRYGSMFMAAYPHIEFEIIPTQPIQSMLGTMPTREWLTTYLQFINEQQPDIISGIPVSLLHMLIDENMLYSLDAKLQQNKYDLETIHPILLQYIRHLGKGQLYALSPTFNGPPVLLINTDLFKEYDLEVPESIVSWEDILLLAQRFPTQGDPESRIFGYTHNDYSSTPSSVLMDISWSLGLQPNIQYQASLHTNEWRSLTELVTSAFRSGAVQYTENSLASPYRSMFKKGRAAMTIGYSTSLAELQQQFQSRFDQGFQWEIRGLPNTGAASSQASNFSLRDLFAIHAQSTSIDAAMEFIQFSSGEDVARVHSKNPSELWSRTTHLVTRNGQSLEPFYELTFDPDAMTSNPLLDELGLTLREMMATELDQIIDHRQSVEDALDKLQIQLQQELDRLSSISSMNALQP